MGSGSVRGRGVLGGVGLSAVTAFALAACVGTQATPAPASAPGSIAPSAGASSLAAPQATATWTLNPVAATAPTPAPTPEPTSEAAHVDLARIPAAPEGKWTSIHWVPLPNAAPAADPTQEPEAAPQTYSSTTSVAGWSRGFVAFTVTVVQQTWDPPAQATITSAHSIDGVTWQPGSSWQQTIGIDNLEIDRVYEGPSGLLAVGLSGACGDSWIEALWTSPDGATWSKVDMKKAFGAATIEHVSGGLAGYVATAESGSAAWTSRDGRTWHAVDMKAGVFKASRVDTSTAFEGGFVLAGSTVATGRGGCGAMTVDPSAPATPEPPMRVPVVWWSADGSDWVRSSLPGAATAYSVGAYVYRLSDRSLILAVFTYGPGDGGRQYWVSNDGRSWTSLGSFTALQPDSILTIGRHALQVVVSTQTEAGTSKTPEATISAISEDGSVTVLTQTGEGPLDPGGSDNATAVEFTLGPTGILATDGTRTWLGLPS